MWVLYDTVQWDIQTSCAGMFLILIYQPKVEQTYVSSQYPVLFSDPKGNGVYKCLASHEPHHYNISIFWDFQLDHKKDDLEHHHWPLAKPPFLINNHPSPRCTCDDCSLSHILTCGIMDPPIAEDLHIKLPLQATEPPQHRDYLAEVHPPSLSSGGSSASASASSSPITIQQHSRLILPEGVATTL